MELCLVIDPVFCLVEVDIAAVPGKESVRQNTSTSVKLETDLKLEGCKMHGMLVCLGNLSKYQPAHPPRERPSKSRV